MWLFLPLRIRLNSKGVVARHTCVKRLFFPLRIKPMYIHASSSTHVNEYEWVYASSRSHEWVHEYEWVYAGVTHVTHSRLTHLCDMTHSHLWHDSPICVTNEFMQELRMWLIHDSLTSVTWLTHMRDTTVRLAHCRRNKGRLIGKLMERGRKRVA